MPCAPRGVSWMNAGSGRSSCGSARSRFGLLFVRSASGFGGSSAVGLGRRFVGRLGLRASVRSIGLPSSSTTVAWSTRNCERLPSGDIRAYRLQTRPAVRDRGAPCRASRSSRSASRSISASTSSSVASIASCATTARSARSASTASCRALAHLVDERLRVLAGGGEVLRDRSTPWCCEPVREVVRAGARISLSTSASGASIGTRSAAASSTLSRTAICACTFCISSSRVADVVAQLVDGVELAGLGRPTRR